MTQWQHGPGCACHQCHPHPDPGRHFLNSVGAGAGGCLGIILVLAVILLIIAALSHGN